MSDNDALSANVAAQPMNTGIPSVNLANAPTDSARIGLTLKTAIESVDQAGASSEALAMETTHRLIQTMSAWLETLEHRRSQLTAELEARTAELDLLTMQIEQERRGADMLAGAARQWSDEIQTEFMSKRSALEEESQEMNRQARAIQESIQQLIGTIKPKQPSLNSTSKVEPVQNGTTDGTFSHQPNHNGIAHTPGA